MREMDARLTENFSVEIPLEEVFRELGGEGKKRLIEVLSCEEEVIRHVADQIIDGFTENFCSGASYYPEKSDREKCSATERARREIACKSSTVYSYCIKNLEKALACLEAENKSLREELRQGSRSF